MRRKDKKSNRIRVMKSRVLILITALAIISVPLIVKAKGTQESQYITIVVRSGDTLWDIASEYTESNKDVRETIYNIKKTNNMDSVMIVPGQKLIVPIK